MKKPRLAILQNEKPGDHLLWEAACREKENLIEWALVDLTAANWLQQVTEGCFDFLLAMPPAYTTPYKTLYDERLRILHQVLGFPVYPSLEEIEIYENKKYQAYWLKANQIPHPQTWVFYQADEALAFLEKAALPIVGKNNIGASGRGVRILKTREQALQYARETFSGKGNVRSVGPNWRKKGFLKRVLQKLLKPAELQSKLRHYRQMREDVQKDFVFFQEFIPHHFEWRCVRIGDSFFAHKKMVVGEMASGSLVKGYENPPLALLDFLKEVTDKRSFWSQSVDVFETAEGAYLVNEMQCIFGQSDPYQMLVDGMPGRYTLQNNQWTFEAGEFNRHQSFTLRLEHVLSMLQCNHL